MESAKISTWLDKSFQFFHLQLSSQQIVKSIMSHRVATWEKDLSKNIEQNFGLQDTYTRGPETTIPNFCFKQKFWRERYLFCRCVFQKVMKKNLQTRENSNVFWLQPCFFRGKFWIYYPKISWNGLGDSLVSELLPVCFCSNYNITFQRTLALHTLISNTCFQWYCSVLTRNKREESKLLRCNLLFLILPKIFFQWSAQFKLIPQIVVNQCLTQQLMNTRVRFGYIMVKKPNRRTNSKTTTSSSLQCHSASFVS